MPAQKKIHRADILRTGISLCRREGMDSINARRLATELGCSTQPIYLEFSGMEELKTTLREEIERVYESYLTHTAESGQYPRYKAYGMGYIRFAAEEPELFKELFMRRRKGDEPAPGVQSLNDVVLPAVTATTGLDGDLALRFHLQLWIHVHGIASMLATGSFTFSEDNISSLISECYTALRQEYLQNQKLNKRKDDTNG